MSIMPLSGMLLVATPYWNGSLYERSIIFVCEHHEQGTVGLICNRPTSYNLDYICEQLALDCSVSNFKDMPLLFGGPIQPERGFVIHAPQGHWRSSLVIREDEVTLTTSNDIIRALAVNQGPQEVIITLGYSSWEPLKLESEILDYMWLICPFDKGLVYETPFSSRWQRAGELLGVKLENMTSGTSGHA